MPVFPVGSNKAPLTPNGHKDASTDPETVRKLFAGSPWGIGGAMGRESGLFAIDSDHYKPGEAGLAAAAFIKDLEIDGLLPETRAHKTQSGGRHYLLRSDTDWPNCKPCKGAEVKGEGGYVVLPPSPGYEVEHESIANAPAGLIDLLNAKKATASMTPNSALKAAIMAGDDFHDSLTLVAARRAAEGASPEKVQSELLEVLNASVAASERHPRHGRWKSLVEDKSKELSRIVFSAESKFNPDAASAALREAAGRRFGSHTVARNFGPGDENSNKDMTAFIAGIDALRAEYRCTVLLIHHSGHAEPGRARGASALRGAVDAEFLVKRSEEQSLVMSNRKMKDGQPPSDLAFIIEAHEVGQRKDGASIFSVALREVPPQQARAKPLTPSQSAAIASFHAACTAKGENVTSLHVEEWRPHFYKSSTADGDGGKKKAFQRGRKGLCDAGVLVVTDDICTLTGAHARPDTAGFEALSQKEPNSVSRGKKTPKQRDKQGV